MADAHKNFAYSTVATAPSPATSGTSLTVASGDGAKFPTAPFNATVWPASAQPLTSNAEIVRVTAVATDTLTIVRAQESSSARTITVGDQIAATITAKTLTDAENPSRATATATTSSLAPAANDSTTTITLGVGYRLYSISTSRPARVRLYETAAQQTADLARPRGSDPAGSAGVVLDYATAAASTVYTLSPLVEGASLESTPSTSIPMTVTNNDTTTGTVTVTLVWIKTE